MKNYEKPNNLEPPLNQIAEPAGKTAGGEEEFNPLTQKNLTTRKGEK
ncbi:MAG: hypothetical protein KH301_03060 [Brachyspira sp.]|nr:hypothetical protein [Brachyspira sp.]